MPTHLYCLLAAGSDSAPPTDAVAVRALIVGGIAAWVSTTSDAKLPRDARRAAQLVIEHDAVIARAMIRVTPVPSTLADPYASDDAVTEDVERRSSEIMGSLRLIDGAVEMAVVLAPKSGVSGVPVPADRPGRNYLEQLRDRPKVLEAAADDIDRQLAGISIRTSRRPERDRLGLSHLVRREHVDDYRRIVLEHRLDAFRIVVDGPRAPYSFAAFSPRLIGSEAGGPERHETGRLGRD